MAIYTYPKSDGKTTYEQRKDLMNWTIILYKWLKDCIILPITEACNDNYHSIIMPHIKNK